MKLIPVFLTVGLTALTVGCAGDRKAAEPATEGAAQQEERVEAVAEMKNAKGEVAGTIRIVPVEGGDGVRLTGDLRNLPPGERGFHIHTVGLCEAPDFKSAGGHFNPTGAMHSLDTKGGHAGDLGNITVGQDGTVSIDTVAQHVTLGDGSHSLFHEGGTSIMVHADPDDLKSDPTGNAGARVACGVITRQ